MTTTAQPENANHNHLTVEQLFRLLQQHLNLWSQPQGLDKIYPQAATLANHLVQSYAHKPGKWIAQLHQHKPHYDHITNLTAKAAIFTCICTGELNYMPSSQTSLVAATLCANLSALNVLTRQANGHPLSDKHKAILARSHILSYKLLIKHHVLDTLWLQSLAGAVPAKQSKRHNRGFDGTIVALACHFGKMLANPKNITKITLLQVMRQLYLETKLPFASDVCQLALAKLHRYAEGTIVKLQNQQMAHLVQLAPDAVVKSQAPDTSPTTFEREDGYVAFVFNDYPNSYQGRFVILAHHHLLSFEPCILCDNAKIYAQIWEAPLDRFLAEKGLNVKQTPQSDDIYTPPTELVELVARLYQQVDLNKIAAKVRASASLNHIVIATATAAAKAQVTIKDAKHALALLGLNRIGPILYRGAIVQKLAKIQFAGRQLVDIRFNCLLASIEFFNNKFNDLVQTEALVMYMQFYLAPYYLNPQVQRTAIGLYGYDSIEPPDTLTLSTLIKLNGDEQAHQQHKTCLKALSVPWQLPQYAQELYRQLNQPNVQLRAAKPIAYGIAIIKLAIFNSQCLYNHINQKQPLVQKLLNEQINTLKIKPQQFYAAQQQFLDHHCIFTPLI